MSGQAEIRKKQIGEFGAGRPDFGGRWPRAGRHLAERKTGCGARLYVLGTSAAPMHMNGPTSVRSTEMVFPGASCGVVESGPSESKTSRPLGVLKTLERFYECLIHSGALWTCVLHFRRDVFFAFETSTTPSCSLTFAWASRLSRRRYTKGAAHQVGARIDSGFSHPAAGGQRLSDPCRSPTMLSREHRTMAFVRSVLHLHHG